MTIGEISSPPAWKMSLACREDIFSLSYTLALITSNEGTFGIFHISCTSFDMFVKEKENKVYILL